MKFTIQAKRVMQKNTKHLLGQFQHEMSHVASYQRNLTTTPYIKCALRWVIKFDGPSNIWSTYNV